MATPTTLPASFTSGQVLTAAQMNNLRGAFRVLQVVSTSQPTSFNTTSTTFVDVTGLSASITPSATSSKVLVILTAMAASSTNNHGVVVDLLRGSTSIGRATSQNYLYLGVTASPPYSWNIATNYLDSPNTTSATTYKVQIRTENAATTAYMGTALVGNFTSNLTLMEISA